MTRKKYRIAIGTVSEYKINAICAGIRLMDLNFIYKATEIDSGVSDQPREQAETKKGAENRAINALDALGNEFDFGIGVEFGYEPDIKNKYRMVCWAAIYTKSDNNLFSEHSSSLELPPLLKKQFETGEQVYEQLDVLLDAIDSSNHAMRAIMILKKRALIYECVQNVVIRYLLDESWYKKNIS